MKLSKYLNAITAAGFGLAIAVPAGADGDTDLTADFRSLVEANSHSIDFREGHLSGPGYDWLLSEGQGAQYFLIGERHATAEIPLVAASLFEGLAKRGYSHAVLEVGHLSGERLDRMLAAGGTGAVRAYMSRPDRQEAIAFMDWFEEVQAADRAKKAGMTVVGFDYEHMFALPQLLDDLAALASKPAERRAVAEVRTQAGDDRFFLGSADPEVFERLREAFAGNDDRRAHVITDTLIASNDIFGAYMGRGHRARSNVVREQLMMRNFGRFMESKAPEGLGPKMAFKLGGFHSAPAIDGYARISFGTMIENHATMMGTSAFNIFIGCNGGESLSSGGSEHEGQPCVSVLAGSGGQNATAATQQGALTPYLADQNKVVLIDLRPLRDRITDWDFLTEIETMMIKGFDAYMAVPGVTPASLTSPVAAEAD